MRKTNPGKDILVNFLEEVEKDKLAHPKPSNAKKLGEACRAKEIDSDEVKDEPKEMDEAAFSRQHYYAIAEILKKAMDNSEHKEESYPVIQEIRQSLIELFSKDNPNFNKDRFLAAAKFQVGGKVI
jgi:hypothetical protein